MAAGPAARRERGLALALAAAAALRIGLFSLAFPFFTNVDEYRHVDVVLKYARGHVPAPGPDPYEPQLAWWIGRFGSPEYHREPGATRPLPPPSWRVDDAEAEARVAHMASYLSPRHSLEADQPPLYYASAGAWLALGRALGLEGGWLLYWLRGLGPLVGFATVWVAWWGLRDLYPDDARVRLGVPALLAFLPQDALYYVTSDLFSPLLGGLAFVLAARLLREPLPGTRVFLVAGLVAGAAVLSKYPNVALAAGALVVTVAVLARGAAAPLGVRRFRVYWTALALPVALWLLRNALLAGDPTGTAFKVERLGWERQAPGDWLGHPLFTPSGLWTFLGHLTATWWRGELVWETRTLAWGWVDRAAASATALCLFGALLRVSRKSGDALQRTTELAALACVLTATIVLALLSLMFVFPERANPSASFPYFVEGRLVCGALVPFALVFVVGLERLCAALPPRLRSGAFWGFLAALALLLLGSEIALSRPVFASPYNAFHLP